MEENDEQLQLNAKNTANHSLSAKLDDTPIAKQIQNGKAVKSPHALRHDPYYRIDPNKYNGWFRGYVRQDWDTVDPDEDVEVEELRAAWIELFFDLIYVAGIVNISEQAVHSFEDEHGHHDDTYVYDSGDYHETSDIESVYFDFLWCTFAQFGLLVSVWDEHVQLQSKFILDQRMDSILRGIIMLFVVFMGASIKDSTEHFQFFLIFFIIIRLLLILVYLKISLIPRAKNHGRANIASNVVIIIVCAILVATVEGDTLTWIAAFVGVYIVTKICGSLARWSIYKDISIPVHVPHIVERFGLFVMLILGESIISLMTTEIDEDTFTNSTHFGPIGWIVVWALAFLITYSIALLYFDSQPSEHAIMHVPGSHALKRTGNRWYASLFLFSNVILQGGLLGFGVGLKTVGYHLENEKSQAVDVMLPGYSLVIICIALNLTRISHPFHSHNVKVWIIRILCVIVMAIVPIFWDDVNQFIILCIITVCILIQVLVDEEGRQEKQAFKQERKEKAKEATQRHNDRETKSLKSSSGLDDDDSHIARNNSSKVKRDVKQKKTDS